MRNVPVRVLCILAIVLSGALLGCDLRRVSVHIADFDTKSVEGVRLWRLSESEGVFLPTARIEFSELREVGGQLWLDYTNYADDGSQGATFQTLLQRNGEAGGTTLDLHFSGVEEVGWFRISTFNAAGESELSAEQILL